MPPEGENRRPHAGSCLAAIDILPDHCGYLFQVRNFRFNDLFLYKRRQYIDESTVVVEELYIYEEGDPIEKAVNIAEFVIAGLVVSGFMLPVFQYGINHTTEEIINDLFVFLVQITGITELDKLLPAFGFAIYFYIILIYSIMRWFVSWKKPARYRQAFETISLQLSLLHQQLYQLQHGENIDEIKQEKAQ